MSKKYRINEFAKRIGRSSSTIRRWEREGKLQTKRLTSGQRYFDETDVHLVFNGIQVKRLIIVYCRVSSANQKSDLESQLEAMEMYCRGAGIPVDEWIREIGGGMNFKRKYFLNILDRILRGEIAKLLIAHKDRLMRFGFELFEYIASQHGCEIIIINQESLSPQQEMIEDLLAIVHTFSCRLYGLKKYKKVLKESLKNQSNTE
ncbi:putative resolvase [Gammaproteobacteria bacterium]